MFKRKGLPEVNELVLCSVKRISPHSAFVQLDEYDGVEGMLHVSEVALRGVNDIRDYLSVGKKIVCKVLNSKPGEVDVSLKRVTSGASKQKLNESRIEKRFYHLVEHACIEAGKKGDVDKVINSFINKFGSIISAYESLRDNGLNFIDGLSFPDKVGPVLCASFESLLKQLSVTIKRNVIITSREGDGVVRIKNLLTSLSPPNHIKVSYSYIGSSKFLMIIEAMNYRIAEDFFSEFSKRLVTAGRESGVMVSFE